MKIKIKPFFQPKTFRYGSISLLIAAIVGIGIFTVTEQKNAGLGENNTDTPKKEIATKDAHCAFRRILDGVCVDSTEETNPKLAAIMIENHTAARPQAGLSAASIIYEAPVEGNIPRFLAIYPLSENLNVPTIGPVRSAREYFLNWVREYGDSFYLHVGGSPEALGHIKQYGINNLDEFFHGGTYFWRSPEHTAPHNTFTSSVMLQALLAKRGERYEDDTYSGWVYTHHPTCAEETCITNLSVDFGGHGYLVRWAYDKEKNQYLRSHGNLPHRDSTTNERLVADTLIIQEVKTRVYDEYGRLNMTQTGTGKATIIRAGTLTNGTWKKETLADRTHWLDEHGNPIVLQPGKIWIEVVNAATEVDIESTSTQGG